MLYGWYSAVVEPRRPYYCPMGCGQTVVVRLRANLDRPGLDRIEAGAELECTAKSCPQRDAAHRILTDPDAMDHVVVLGASEFSIVHPLRERLDMALAACQLNHVLGDWDNPLHPPGRYRVTLSGQDWVFARLDPL